MQFYEELEHATTVPRLTVQQLSGVSRVCVGVVSVVLVVLVVVVVAAVIFVICSSWLAGGWERG